MNRLLTKSNRVLFLTILMIMMLVISSIALVPFGQEGLILFVLVSLVAVAGILGSHLIALGVTLLIYFFLGSILFWLAFTGNVVAQNKIPFFYILLWMVVLLIISLISGRLSTNLKTLETNNDTLNEQIRTLVAIDPTTGFDNEDRFLLELQLENNRSKRYNHTFTLLLFKINHLEQFKKLYGEDELINLLNYIAKNTFKSTRSSDQKFRVAYDTFALLLPDTHVDSIQIVIDKLEDELAVYQLKDKKFVTLAYEFGYVGFDPDVESHLELYEIAKEQVLAHVS